MQIEPDKLFSKSAECAVLGSMIIDPACISKAMTILQGSTDFYLSVNQGIYDTLIGMYIGNTVIDGLTIRDELSRNGLVKSDLDNDTKITEYIVAITQTVPSSANIEYYSKIVVGKHRYRQFISTVEIINGLVNETGSTTDELIQEAQGLILSLEQNKVSEDFIELPKAAARVLIAMRDETKSINTGFRGIDNYLGGFQVGELIVVAARPRMGKSSLMLDFALNIAHKGHSSLTFSLEMTADSLIERAVSNLTKVNLADAKADRIPKEDWNKIYGEIINLEKLNLIISTQGNTIEKQIALIRKVKKAHDIKVVFIDHLQLMETVRKSENRVQEITEITRRLKLMAMDENITVVVLSQLNRLLENRTDKRPKLSDLRDSGSIEQDADQVIMIHREDCYRPAGSEKDGVAEIIITKNRRGPAGTIEMGFFEHCTKFVELCPEWLKSDE